MTQDVRHYLLSDKEKMNCWLSLLGGQVINKMMEYDTGNDDKINEMERDLLHDLDVQWIKNFLDQDAEEGIAFLKGITFSRFYYPWIVYGTNILRERLEKWFDWHEETVYEDFQKALVNQLQKICVRTLIGQLQEQKLSGELLGDSLAEEYEDYNNRILASLETLKEILCEFPELRRRIAETIHGVVQYYAEIMENYQKEYAQIKQRLPIRENERKIVGISSGFGDSHNNGRQVVCVTLECGTKILYKPHSMENDMAYYELLRWLEENTKIRQKYIPMVSKSNHGWCAIVDTETCVTEKELEKYYERFGVHLFLTWLLGTKDLHFENVIASGAYPVIVDLEVLMSANSSSMDDFIEIAIINEISTMTFSSGLLPYHHWNRGGNGIDGSALAGGAGQMYPFQIPIIVNDKTSEMHVEYIQPLTRAANNLATLNDVFVSPARYEAEIKRGFMNAFEAVRADRKSFLQKAKVLQGVHVRHLVTDTQRYSMLLNSSYHPSLMKSTIEREIFLHAIWTGRYNEKEAVIEYEVESMLEGDIPLFYYLSNMRDLCACGRVIVKNYFKESAYQTFVNRVLAMNINDSEKQCDAIALSLRMINDGERRYLNRIYSVSEMEQNVTCNEILVNKQEMLLGCILKYAVWNESKTKVSWYTVLLGEGENVTWSLTPMNMYLYDGLSGMILVLMKAQKAGMGMDLGQYTNVLRKTLFSYTDAGKKDTSLLHSMQTGAYEGEASIVYTYLLLFDMTKDPEYFMYAKKHAQIVMELLPTDSNYDLLAGNAGAAQMLLWLYRLTDDKTYLAAAEYAIELLWKAGVAQEKGVGWIADKNSPPMSGMAHGNAGILMPVMWLWELTHESKYEEMAEEIWKYEDYLYNESTRNWDDMRMKKPTADSIGAVAWCHGAPGILLSRMFCYPLTQDEKWRQRFAIDMRKAYNKLRTYWKRDSWSLCHGNCGNLWILELAEEFFAKEKIVIEMDDLVSMTMKKQLLEKDISYLPQEILNPGLMNGYGGILLYLLSIK